jgi:hypothetical protein
MTLAQLNAAVSDADVQQALVSGTNIKTVGGASLLGSGDVPMTSALATTSIKTTTYTAVANDLVRVNSSGGAFTVTLPSAPADGDKVGLLDVTNSCGTNAVLLAAAGGRTVEGDADGLSVNIPGASVELIYSSTGTNWKVAQTPVSPSGPSTTTSLTYTYSGVLLSPFVVLPFNTYAPAVGSGLESVQSMLMGTSNTELTSLTFSKLAFFGTNLTPNGWTALTSISFPELSTISGNFGLSTMNALTTLSLPKLKHCLNFQPTGMAALTTLSLPELTATGAAFTPTVMAALTTISIPKLETVTGNFSPATMGSLTTLSAPVLTVVGGNFAPTTMASLTTLSMPELQLIGGTLAPGTLGALTTLSFPKLEVIGQTIAPVDMGNLTSVSLPMIKVIGATTASGSVISLISGTAALTTFTLPSSLRRVGNGGGNVVITSAALTQASVDSILVQLAALDGTAGTIAFSSRTVTITGTSSTPSATGLAAKATLQARGCTVTNN